MKLLVVVLSSGILELCSDLTIQLVMFIYMLALEIEENNFGGYGPDSWRLERSANVEQWSVQGWMGLMYGWRIEGLRG